MFAVLSFGLAILAMPAFAGDMIVSERFGVRAFIPDNWTSEPSANGDGRTFNAPDGDGRILVFGGFALSREDEVAIYRSPAAGETITYERVTLDGVIVAGNDADGSAFMRRTIIKCDDEISSSVEVHYAGEWTPTLTDVVASLDVACQ